MQPVTAQHPDDELIEQYCMNLLAEARATNLEEHLIVCEGCRERLDETDAFTRAIRVAALHWRRRQASEAANRSRRWADWPAWAGAFGAAVLIVLLAGQARMTWFRTPPPMTVILTAARGAAESSIAPAGTPLILNMDLTELPAHPTYRVEIVDATGIRVWQSVVTPEGGKLIVRLRSSLTRGAHFVRLYPPTGDLLREYALQVGAD